MNPLDLIGKALGPIEGIIGQFVDTPEEKAKAQALLAEHKAKLQELAFKSERERAKTVRAEIQGQSWMQRNWRPLTALGFAFIVFNNFVFVPYAQAFGLQIPRLDMPAGLWALLTTMIGGYTASRGWEKVKGKADNKIPSITDQVLDRISDASQG